ncbi:hypothetical protein, conserved [Eimeria brunetti]|uniref:60 kDa inner membrane protein n=1 Tax=Eimeria brunetti TaxID=51314 RepID=U6LH02_9EIME|nr:hypothetical protein, conserved [Eimeria brunetti]
MTISSRFFSPSISSFSPSFFSCSLKGSSRGPASYTPFLAAANPHIRLRQPSSAAAASIESCWGFNRRNLPYSSPIDGRLAAAAIAAAAAAAPAAAAPAAAAAAAAAKAGCFSLPLLSAAGQVEAGVGLYSLSSRSFVHSSSSDAAASSSPPAAAAAAGETPAAAAAAGSEANGINVNLQANKSEEIDKDLTQPPEGSYAYDLLQHIRQAAEGTGEGVSCSWFIDWILALKLTLGVPWSIALPAAGCLLRLLTLPIAVDSERDRRQRQLVDPQFSRLKDKMKAAYEAGNTAEYERLRLETKSFLKKHGIGVLPVSFLQMLLLGIAISLSTPAIRSMAREPMDHKGFALEQPIGLQSLALPDKSASLAFASWAILISTMAV